MRSRLRILLPIVCLLILSGCAQRAGAMRFPGRANFLTDFSPLNDDGSINAVIEIPAGTTAKWEVMKPHGALEWERSEGRPRVVQYLGYPGNYGMVPGTLGGDGDALDVLVLGPAVPRGSLVRAKVIGVLELLDRGEQDDKLIAVLEQTPFYELDELHDLNERFSGVAEIVEIWFSNYKGPGKMESRGFGDAGSARRTLQNAIDAARSATP